MDKDLFATRLRKQRKKKGYQTQSQFAKAYNDSFPTKRKDEANGNNDCSGILGTIKNYENPNYIKSMPSIDKVLNMCELLGCDIDYLTGRLDYQTHNVKFISEYTGLTEEAIELLHYFNNSYDVNKRTISFLNLVLSDYERFTTPKEDGSIDMTIFHYLDQYVHCKDVKRVVYEDQKIPNSLEEFKQQEARRYMEENSVLMQSGEFQFELVGIRELYRMKKLEDIKKSLDEYLKKENEDGKEIKR